MGRDGITVLPASIAPAAARGAALAVTAALAIAAAAALAAAVALAVAATTDLVSSAPSLFRAVHQGVYHGSRRNDDNDDVQPIQRDGGRSRWRARWGGCVLRIGGGPVRLDNRLPAGVPRLLRGGPVRQEM